MAQTIPGPPPIVRGHYYPPLQVHVTGVEEALFPDGCRLRAQIRYAVWSDTVLAELTTENGGLRRVDDTTVEMTIGAADTANMGTAKERTVVLDIVRTDVEPDLYLYVQFTIEVRDPVTRD